MEKLRLNDFLDYKFISNIEHSPSGEHACFVVHEADLASNEYKSNLWLLDTENGQSFQLTALNKERSFTWLNEKELLFTAVREENDREVQKQGEDWSIFYKINITGGEAQEAFRLPLRIERLQPLTNGCYLLTATYNPSRPDLSKLSEEERKIELEKRKEAKDYEVLEEIPYWSNGRGFISGNRSRLYLYDQNNNSYEALTSESLQISHVELNQTKTQAIIIGSEFTGKAPLTNALYLADLLAKTVTKLTPEEEFAYSEAYFIGEDQIICKGNDRLRFGMNQNARFYLVDLKDGQKKLLTPDFETSTWSSVGSDCRYGGGSSVQVDQNYLYFLTTEGSSSYLNRIDVHGRIEKVTQTSGSVDSYSVHNGNVLLVAFRELRLQELYELRGGQEHALTQFNDWVQRERKLATLEAISFETVPGITIDGWVMKPVDFKENKKYPAILNIHGGPKTVYGSVFFHEMQYWANQGYFVFFCNPRGSDGKGNEFADIRGKYGTIDYDDLMRFTDLVLEQYPQIDSDNVGVTGGSYGGFMTNWIIGQTNRFKAAASQRSISNWISMGFTTDIGYYFAADQIGATPWSNQEKLWEHSPLKYADQVQTPTLFIHAEEDYRCWLPEGLQMFSALKYHGIEARLCMFRGENHELSRSGKPKHRIRRLEEITSWFDCHLQNSSN